MILASEQCRRGENGRGWCRQGLCNGWKRLLRSPLNERRCCLITIPENMNCFHCSFNVEYSFGVERSFACSHECCVGVGVTVTVTVTMTVTV